MTEKSEKSEKSEKIAKDKACLRSPNEVRFPNFEPAVRKASGGAQGKNEHSGFYKVHNSNEECHFKSSQKFPGDDMAEVAGSILLVNLIGQDNAKRYKFKKNLVQRNNFVYSPVIPGSRKLSQENIDYRGKDWRGCTPTTLALKKKIDSECFTTAQLRRDMAKILVSCKIVLERDCQVDNIIKYTDANGNLRLQKYDNGHALRGILAEGNHIVVLHENPSIFGKALNHKGKRVVRILPTDHTNDYPDIVNSPEFLQEIDAAYKNLPQTLAGVDQGLNEIMEKNRAGTNEELTEKLQKEAMVIYADHLGYTGKTHDKTAEKLRQDISDKLKVRIIERAHSLLLVKSLLQIKYLTNGLSAELKGKKAISLKNSRMIAIALVNLINTVKKFQGQHVNHFMPVLKDAKASQLIKQLVKLANRCNQQFKGTTGRELIGKESLDFVSSLRNKNTVIAGNKLSDQELIEKYIKKPMVEAKVQVEEIKVRAEEVKVRAETPKVAVPGNLLKVQGICALWESLDSPVSKQPHGKALEPEPTSLTFSLQARKLEIAKIRGAGGIRRNSLTGQAAQEGLVRHIRSYSV